MFFTNMFVQIKKMWEYITYPSKYYSKKYSKRYAKQFSKQFSIDEVGYESDSKKTPYVL